MPGDYGNEGHGKLCIAGCNVPEVATAQGDGRPVNKAFCGRADPERPVPA